MNLRELLNDKEDQVDKEASFPYIIVKRCWQKR